MQIKSKEEHVYESDYQRAVRRREETAMRELRSRQGGDRGSFNTKKAYAIGATKLMEEPAWMDKYNHVKELKDGDLVEVVGQHLSVDVRRYLRRDGQMPLTEGNEGIGDAINRALARTR